MINAPVQYRIGPGMDYTSKRMAPEVVFSNTSDRSDFLKFAKFLALKGVQIIVHSRKGIKSQTNCKLHSSDTDWFNLAIQDSADVTKATKKAICADILNTFRAQLHVDISLKTLDGDEMMLEIWSFGLDHTQFDPTLKAMSTVYYRMGILLKSLISATRITPAYKLARRQSEESYGIFYHVYTGEARVGGLGEDSKELKVGMLRTPLGGMCISVNYRTNMIISPNKSQKNDSLLLKSDHFELSPKHIVYENRHKVKKDMFEKAPIDLTKPMRPAAFVDVDAIDKIVREFYEKYPVPRARVPSPAVNITTVLTQGLQAESPSPTPVETPPRRFPGFRSENEPPLKLLHFPFADRHPIRELAEFYKDFFNAPYLKLTSDSVYSHKSIATDHEAKTSSENEGDLSKELEIYESSIQEFDEMLKDMLSSAEGSSG